MVDLVIASLGEDIKQLEDLKRMIDKVINDVETKNNKQIYIKSSEYSNGFYIQQFEPKFEECIDFIKKLSEGYERAIKDKGEILSGLLE